MNHNEDHNEVCYDFKLNGAVFRGASYVPKGALLIPILGGHSTHSGRAIFDIRFGKSHENHLRYKMQLRKIQCTRKT